MKPYRWNAFREASSWWEDESQIRRIDARTWVQNAIPSVCAIIFIGAVIFLLAHIAGCQPPPPKLLEQAAAVEAVATYDQELIACQQTARQKPKEQRFEAFVDCEQAVSRRFCQSSQPLRESWDRCKEVLDELPR